MAKSTNANSNGWNQKVLKHALNIHFGLIVLYAAYISLSLAWHLITPEAGTWRWTALAILSVSVILIWAANREQKTPAYHRNLLWLLIMADIAFASFNVFSQRGMASRAVALYPVPIVLSAYMLRLRWLVATAVICSASYIFSAWWYFHTHFNEGYKAELVFEVGFYSIGFFILAALLWNLVHPKKS